VGTYNPYEMCHFGDRVLTLATRWHGWTSGWTLDRRSTSRES